jgi:hypothetical protein
MMPVDIQPGQTVHPPRVRFETRALDAGIVDGKMTYRDVDFVCVTPPGSYSEFEGIATEWIERQRRQPYHDALVRAYDAFKAGKEPPVEGTPVEQCTMFTPAEVKTMKTVGVRAVEEMAAWPDGNLGMFGMGAVRLKQKAQAWMSSAASSGVAAAQIDDLKSKLSTALDDNDQLRGQLKGMEARLAALEGPRPKLGLKGNAA